MKVKINSTEVRKPIGYVINYKNGDYDVFFKIKKDSRFLKLSNNTLDKTTSYNEDSLKMAEAYPFYEGDNITICF